MPNVPTDSSAPTKDSGGVGLIFNTLALLITLPIERMKEEKLEMLKKTIQIHQILN